MGFSVGFGVFIGVKNFFLRWFVSEIYRGLFFVVRAYYGVSN